MRAFACQNCHQLVFFENSRCLRCGSALGFDPGSRELLTFVADEPGPTLVAPDGGDRYRRCANAELAACNWVLHDGDDGSLCLSCSLTRTRPADADREGLVQFREAEIAKRRLVFQLLDLGLPLVPRREDPRRGLAFDLLSSTWAPVVTGHQDGLITLDLAESDNAHREELREQLGEPYRTVLGHVRHEVGHHYWEVLVDRGGPIDRFRELFGDERLDYGEALQRHYADGPPADWPERHVSAYATMHPWEDWAETFAHYLHIRDTLQTSASFGLVVTGPKVGPARDPALVANPVEHPDQDPFSLVVLDWLALTYALNAVNRSMGRDDLYPFVLTPTVIDKLTFVHDLVRLRSADPAGADEAAGSDEGPGVDEPEVPAGRRRWAGRGWPRRSRRPAEVGGPGPDQP